MGSLNICGRCQGWTKCIRKHIKFVILRFSDNPSKNQHAVAGWHLLEVTSTYDFQRVQGGSLNGIHFWGIKQCSKCCWWFLFRNLLQCIIIWFPQLFFLYLNVSKTSTCRVWHLHDMSLKGSPFRTLQLLYRVNLFRHAATRRERLVRSTLQARLTLEGCGE